MGWADLRFFGAAGIVALLAGPALAGSAIDDYLAARDGYIATFKKYDDAGTFDDAVQAEHDKALADLEAKIKPVVGDVHIAGIDTEGHLSLSTLFPSDVGFAILDGLVFTSGDESEHVLVTTDGLFDHWFQGTEDLPKAKEEAWRSEDFYTEAISADAALLRYAEVPVKAGGASFAYAMLGIFAQDIGNFTPDTVVVTVAKGGRLFVADATVSGVAAIPACDAVWNGYQKKMDDALAAYQASDPQDESLFDAYTKLQDEADLSFRKCFAEKAAGEPWFPDVTKKAQTLADGLP